MAFNKLYLHCLYNTVIHVLLFNIAKRVCFMNSFMIIFSTANLNFVLYIEQVEEIISGDQSSMDSDLVLIQEVMCKRHNIRN